MRILGVVKKGKRTTFNAQFTTNASDATGNYTTSIVNSVTFSGGAAVWSAQSPPAYIVTNEEGFLLDRKLTVTTRVNSPVGGYGKPVWTIVNAALNSYIGLTYVTMGVGSFNVINSNGVSITTGDIFPVGSNYDVEVRLSVSGLVEIFVNGSLEASKTIPVFTPMNRKLYIGYRPTYASLGFIGSMDYLKVEEG